MANIHYDDNPLFSLQSILLMTCFAATEWPTNIDGTASVCRRARDSIQVRPAYSYSAVLQQIVATYHKDKKISELTRLISGHAPAKHEDSWGLPACRGGACLMYGLFLVQLHQAITGHMIEFTDHERQQLDQQVAGLVKARDKAMKRALAYGGMRFLNRILASRSFLHSTLKVYCVPLLAQAVEVVIRFHEENRLQVLYRSRQEALERVQQSQQHSMRRRQHEHALQDVDKADCLEDLLSLVRGCVERRAADGFAHSRLCGYACVAMRVWRVLRPPQITQLCRLNPEVAASYWERRPSHASNLALFVPNAGNSMGTSIPFMTVYLDMLSAMAKGPMVDGVGADSEGCPWLVYRFLTPSEDTPTTHYCPMACTFERLFHTVKAYVELLGPSGMAFGVRNTESGDRRVAVREMPPQDTMALMAFLRLVQSLVALPRIREQVVDAWHARKVLFELLRCGVVLELKGELMCTLASLVDGPDAALFVWDELERSQVLQTAPRAEIRAGSHTGGIKFELKKSFSYPYVCGFLRLLNSLVRHRVPLHLGYSYRVPGIDPYLTFVLEDVFLRKAAAVGSGNSSAQLGGARWEAVALCLEYFNQFVETYDVYCDPRRPGEPTTALPPALAAAAAAMSQGATSEAAAAAPTSVGGRPETDFVFLPNIMVGSDEYVAFSCCWGGVHAAAFSFWRVAPPLFVSVLVVSSHLSLAAVCVPSPDTRSRSRRASCCSTACCLATASSAPCWTSFASTTVCRASWTAAARPWASTPARRSWTSTSRRRSRRSSTRRRPRRRRPTPCSRPWRRSTKRSPPHAVAARRTGACGGRGRCCWRCGCWTPH